MLLTSYFKRKICFLDEKVEEMQQTNSADDTKLAWVTNTREGTKLRKTPKECWK